MLRLVSPREELGKNINADEAAAMGAVYQAAALSKAFKVKPFAVRDAVIYPILVSLAVGPAPVASLFTQPALFSCPHSYPQNLPWLAIVPSLSCCVGGVHKGGGGGAWGSKPEAQ